MKKLNVVLSALCLATLALSSAAARADGLNLSSYIGDTISMQVLPYASGENNGAFYVGLTNVNLATVPGGTAIGTIAAFCDDFADEIVAYQTYNVVVEAVTGNTTLEEEAYYGTMFNGNQTMDTDLQELIWDLGDTKTPPYILNPEMLTLQSDMQTSYASANYSDDFYLSASAAGDDGQSFMEIGPAPAPEPPTLLTLATGLIGLAFVARRRAAPVKA